MNTGLRGHQFVKEGAEEFLELRALAVSSPDLLVCYAKCAGDPLLLIDWGNWDWPGLKELDVDVLLCALRSV